MSEIKNDSSRMPYLTGHLPGIGGEIKVRPQHFEVEEIPLYEACGEGEHIYVCLARHNWNTRDLQQKLAILFGLREVDVGFAGLKDKQARVTQTFSLCLARLDVEEAAQKISASLPVEVLWTRRHRNKIKRGHLIGNRFRILVSRPDGDAVEKAAPIAAYLEEHGFANYYGEQRFGRRGDNAELGKDLLWGKKRYSPWLRRFLISAYQSALYNDWLSERIARGEFDRLILGDVAKKNDTGGMFEVEDLAKETPRFERREITYTGPVYGYRMYEAGGDALKFEQEILARAGASPSMFKAGKVWGSRRPARLFAKDLRYGLAPDGMIFTFDLPKGAYATTILREFLKTDPAELPSMDDGDSAS